jgi:hypothetical protein
MHPPSERVGSVTESAGTPQRTGREPGDRSAVAGAPCVLESCPWACAQGSDCAYHRQNSFARSAETVTHANASVRCCSRRSRFGTLSPLIGAVFLLTAGGWEPLEAPGARRLGSVRQQRPSGIAPFGEASGACSVIEGPIRGSWGGSLRFSGGSFGRLRRCAPLSDRSRGSCSPWCWPVRGG